MGKKLTRQGSKLVLVIEQPLLDTLGLDEETELEVTASGDSLTIKPKSGQPEVEKRRLHNLKKSAEETMQEYQSVFEKLSKT